MRCRSFVRRDEERGYSHFGLGASSAKGAFGSIPARAALDGVDYAFPPHSSVIVARRFELEAAGPAIVLRMTRA
jgi:hypothetical protein